MLQSVVLASAAEVEIALKLALTQQAQLNREYQILIELFKLT
jgi:hypothetical protein